MNKVKNFYNNDISLSNKKGNIIYYVIFSFIALILFVLLMGIIPNVYDKSADEEDYTSDTSFIATATSNETLSPIGEGISSATATRKNSTWVSLNGVGQYIRIPDNDYISVAFWVNNSVNNWTFVVNSSDLLYENGNVVSSLTMNPFTKLATTWYFGWNGSGFFEGNIDTIKFYNDTMNESQVSELYAAGR